MGNAIGPVAQAGRGCVRPRALSAVALTLAVPPSQRPGFAANLGRDRHNRRSSRLVPGLGLPVPGGAQCLKNRFGSHSAICGTSEIATMNSIMMTING